jgi:hypothetical protein
MKTIHATVALVVLLLASFAAPGRCGREAVWSRRRASGDRGESPAQAATDRPAPRAPAGAQPDAERPAAVPDSGRSSSIQAGFERSPSLSAARRSWRVIRRWCVASSASCSHRGARKSAGRKGRTRHSSGPSLTQVAQSSVRLSPDGAHHVADVRDYHRQERRLPRAVETRSPCAGWPRPVVVVVHRSYHRQGIRRTAS